MKWYFRDVSAILLFLLWSGCYFHAHRTYRSESAGFASHSMRFRMRSCLVPMAFWALRKLPREIIDLWRRWMLSSLVPLTDPYELASTLREETLIVACDLCALAGLWGLGLLLSPLLFLLFLALWFLRWFATVDGLRRRRNRLYHHLEMQLPAMLTRLILALQSGTLLMKAWREIAQEGCGPVYEEMMRVYQMQENGLPLRVALASFGRRFDVPGFRDCADQLSQSIEVGGADLARGLQRIRQERVEAQRRTYTMLAARASQQMLFPSLLLFIGILLLVIVPFVGQEV